MISFFCYLFLVSNFPGCGHTVFYRHHHIAYNEGTAKQTWANVQRDSKIAIAVADRENMKGFRFTGTPEIITSGKLFEEAVAISQKAGRPAPKAVIKVKIEKIFNLGVPGAGE